MKFLQKALFVIMFIYFNAITTTKCQGFGGDGSDPFKSLGIPDLNPQRMLDEMDSKKNQNQRTNEVIHLKSIADVPKFLKKSNITQEEAIDQISKFLLSDDSNLKSYGGVYDQTGFEGLKKEKIAEYGTEERLIQRAKSSAYLWYLEKFGKFSTFEKVILAFDEVINNWKVYNVLLNIKGTNEKKVIRVCIPLDESEPAMSSDKNEPCAKKAEYVDQERKKNEEYLESLRSNPNFPTIKRAKKEIKENNGSGNINNNGKFI